MTDSVNLNTEGDWSPEGEGWATYLDKRPPNGAMIEVTRRVNARSKIINADDLHLPHDPQYLFWRLAARSEVEPGHGPK